MVQVKLKKLLWEVLKREIKEEVGSHPKLKRQYPETFISTDPTIASTYLCTVKEEFIPSLNGEHDGYAWVRSGSWLKR